MLARRMVPQLQQFVLGWGPEMNLLTSYGLAGLIFFMVGAAVDSDGGLQEQLSGDHAALLMPPATPSPDVEIPPLSADKAISDALAMHGNHQRIPLSVFMDLIRTMERSGFERSAAICVVVELAKNPNLDNIAGLTVTGSLRGYQETTNEKLDEAVTELVRYIERPDWWSSRVNEKFGLLPPNVERLIGEKISSGNQIAAERLMEEALLQRFNPSLAAKIFVPRIFVPRIFVPRDEFPFTPDTVLSREPSGTEQCRQTQQVGVKASEASASPPTVTARAWPPISRTSLQRLRTPPQAARIGSENLIPGRALQVGLLRPLPRRPMRTKGFALPLVGSVALLGSGPASVPKPDAEQHGERHERKKTVQRKQQHPR